MKLKLAIRVEFIEEFVQYKFPRIVLEFQVFDGEIKFFVASKIEF